MDRRAHRHQRAPHRARPRARPTSPRWHRARRWRRPACSPARSTSSCSARRRRIGCCRRPRSISKPRSARAARPRSTWEPRAPDSSTAATVAESMIAAGNADTALVVGVEKLSAIIDWTDRSTCVLFGDGAGAAVLKRSKHGKGILSTFIRSDGTLGDLLCRRGGGAARPFSADVLAERSQFITMNGREVFKNAVRSMSEACDRALDAAKLTGARHRPADPAPGQHPDHRGDRQAREHPDGQGLRERGPLRQHVGRFDADRARRGDREGNRSARARPCCSWPSAPASPGVRWSCASDHGRRPPLPGSGLAEARHGQGPRRRVCRGARRVRARRRGARHAAQHDCASKVRPRS